MITITRLTKKFKNFTALNELSLHVNKGEIYGFIGHNGAGKSTTLNILAGLTKPTSGACRLNNKNVLSINHPSELNIGFLPEEPKFYGWMTAFEMLEYLSVHKDKTIINDLLKWVGLFKSKNRKINGFSRGMKQRLGIATALIHDPEVIILDEPSSALDPQGRRDVLDLILDLKNKGKTVIFSTHILSDVERVCDKVGIISNGKMVLQKSMKQLINYNFTPVLNLEFFDKLSGNEIKSLKDIESVNNIEMNNGVYSLYLGSNKDYNDIVKSVVKSKLKLKSFNIAKNSLESIFIREANRYVWLY